MCIRDRYTDYILYFQLAGIVLLLAMIGAILLTFRERVGVKKQSYLNQISRNPSNAVELIIVIGGWKYKPDLLNSTNLFIEKGVSNTHSLGQVLYTDYIHVFQISGMILLIAMIGAIVLTFRQREGVKKQSYLKQISRERTEGVEVLEVAPNKGVKIDD